MKNLLLLLLLSTSLLAQNTNYMGSYETPFTRSLKSNDNAQGWLSLLGAGATNAMGSNATYIAYRTDGRMGTGTFSDPYNGSTYTNLERILSNAPAGQTIVFHPSTNYTIRPKLSNGSYTWTPKSGQSIIGLGGMNAVKITFSTNTAEAALYTGAKNAFAVAANIENFSIQGIWIDCNVDYFNRYTTNTSGSVFQAGQMADLTGDNLELSFNRVSGNFGGWTTGVQNSSECFPIGVGGMTPTFTNGSPQLTRYYKGNRVIGNEVVHTNILGLAYSYGGSVANFNYAGAGNRCDLVYKSNLHWLGWNIIEGNRLICATNASQANYSCGPRTIIRGNVALNAGLFFNDTGMAGDIIIENNVASCWVGSIIRFNITSNDASHFEMPFDITIRNNRMERRPSIYSPNVNILDTVLYVTNASGVGIFTNLYTGNLVGATNWIIEGNTFIGPTNLSVSAIAVAGDKISIKNNQFKNINVAITPRSSLSKEWVIQGNLFQDGFQGIAIDPTNTNNPPVNRTQFLIANNRFENLSTEAVIGGTDNLYILNNSVNNCGKLRDPGIAFYITTNSANLGAGYFYFRNHTNVVIAGNTFFENHTNAHTWEYDVVLGGVNGFYQNGNTGNRGSGVAIGSFASYTENASNQVGITVNNALYVTNASGAANIYTNGVLFTGSGGGGSGSNNFDGNQFFTNSSKVTIRTNANVRWSSSNSTAGAVSFGATTDSGSEPFAKMANIAFDSTGNGLYISTNGSLMPFTDGVAQIGNQSDSFRWSKLYLSGGSSSGIYTNGVDIFTVTPLSKPIITSGLIPASTTLTNLGTIQSGSGAGILGLTGNIITNGIVLHSLTNVAGNARVQLLPLIYQTNATYGGYSVQETNTLSGVTMINSTNTNTVFQGVATGTNGANLTNFANINATNQITTPNLTVSSTNLIAGAISLTNALPVIQGKTVLDFYSGTGVWRARLGDTQTGFSIPAGNFYGIASGSTATGGDVGFGRLSAGVSIIGDGLGAMGGFKSWFVTNTVPFTNMTPYSPSSLTAAPALTNTTRRSLLRFDVRDASATGNITVTTTNGSTVTVHIFSAPNTNTFTVRVGGTNAYGFQTNGTGATTANVTIEPE